MSDAALNGRTAVITGASRGLGAGLAADFHTRGLRLALCARGEIPLADAPGRVFTQRLDVRDASAVEAFAQEAARRLGPIDLWINNAGVLDPIGPMRDVDPAALRENLEINVLGVVHGSQSYTRHVRQRGGEGVLINVSSGAGRRPYAGWAAYCASKAAVDRLTECVQEEEQATGLRAYAVAPGVIETAMQERIRACSEEEFPEVERFRELQRTGGLSRPEFVAGELLRIAFDPSSRPTSVEVRLPAEAPHVRLPR